MCERELADPELLRMAHVIYVEISRQLGGEARAMIDADHNLREVVLEGSIDLLKVAAALSKRCCVHAYDVETIAEVATADLSMQDLTPVQECAKKLAEAGASVGSNVRN